MYNFDKPLVRLARSSYICSTEFVCGTHWFDILRPAPGFFNFNLHCGTPPPRLFLRTGFKIVAGRHLNSPFARFVQRQIRHGNCKYSASLMQCTRKDSCEEKTLPIRKDSGEEMFIMESSQIRNRVTNRSHCKAEAVTIAKCC
jgi:hypothetical protein